MKLSVGDKVKFLNSKGGGVVSAILDSRMVKVLVEGGFELPTLASELILVNPTVAGGHYFDENFDVSLPETPPEEEQPDERIESLSQEAIRKRNAEEIFLAFIPQDQKWLITGLLDVVLVNNTSWDVLYNLFLEKEEKKFTGKDYGSLFAGTRLLLATIDRDDLPQWTSGIIQLLYFKEDEENMIPPFNAEFRIQGKKFFSESNYRLSPLIEGNGIVIRLVSVSEYLQKKALPRTSSAKTLAPSTASEPELILKYQTQPREAEVDLHIHRLVEDPSDMEKSEILDFQVNYFLHCLESAIASHFLKITFIHGVGNGTLREALISEIKKYDQIEFFDAPMNKYGVGAIEVRIPHNFQK